jgi:hypothetical protein
VSGAAADDQFGWWVAGVGDVDGDGVGDIAVGARFHMVGPDTAAGAVYLYRAGLGAATTPAVRLEGISDHEHFGESIAGGHDVDGDGRPDLAVGAPLRDGPGGSAAGAVDLFRGGFLGGAWGSLGGEAKDDWFGQSVALGDLDGDGLAEVIVGAPYNDRVASAAGAVFVFRGGATPPAVPWRVLTGEAANDQFGWSVAYLGDLDGDGFGDLAVGARLFGSGLMAARGKAYLYRGGPVMDEIPDGAWLGESRDDWFGNALVGPGDVDGNGGPDLLVGAPYNDRGGSAAGAAYLLRGEDPPGSAPAAIYVGESADAHFGWSVGGGDADGDGRADAIVGARMQASAGGSAAGRMYLFRGASPPSAVPELTADGEAPNDWLGHSVGGAVGFFAPSRAAAVGGAPYHDAGGSAAGRGYLLGLNATAGVPRSAPSWPRLTVLPNPSRGATTIHWRRTSGTKVDILDTAGRRVRLLEGVPVGDEMRARWDGASEDGGPAPPGLYVVRVADGEPPLGPRAGAAKLIVLP